MLDMYLPPYDRLPRRHWLTAAPLRLHGTPTADPITLHTVQTEGAYNELRMGHLTGDRQHADPVFVEAYEWLTGEMNDRLPTSGNGIVWAWARINHRELISGLRRDRGQVLLTLRIPRNRVLLSHFGDWHMVLNRGIHTPVRPGETIDQWWARAEPIGDDFHNHLTAAGANNTTIRDWPSDLYEEAATSWRHIFNPDTWEPTAPVQATLHHLTPDDVVRAVRIR